MFTYKFYIIISHIYYTEQVLSLARQRSGEPEAGSRSRRTPPALFRRRQGRRRCSSQPAARAPRAASRFPSVLAALERRACDRASIPVPHNNCNVRPTAHASVCSCWEAGANNCSSAPHGSVCVCVCRCVCVCARAFQSKVASTLRSHRLIFATSRRPTSSIREQAGENRSSIVSSGCVDVLGNEKVSPCLRRKVGDRTPDTIDVVRHPCVSAWTPAQPQIWALEQLMMILVVLVVERGVDVEQYAG